MNYMGDTRADSQVLWLTAAAKTASRGRFENDSETLARLDEALRGGSGADAEGGLADANLAAARLMVESAGMALRACAAFALAGDAEGAALAAAAAAKCVDAIQDPAGTPHAADIDGAARSGDSIVKAARVLARRAGDNLGKRDEVERALASGGDPCVHGVAPALRDARPVETGAHE